MKKLFFLIATTFALCSCNIDEEFTIESPKIILDNESGIYSTKVGSSITISPRYENAENAIFTWSINDSVIATTPTLQFCSNTLGEFYISIQVENEIGKEKREIRVDVVEVEIPIVSLANAEKGFVLALNTEMKFTALVRETSLPTTYSWQLNGEVVSNSLSYTFLAKELGDYTLVFEAKNEDGADKIETKIEVVEFAPAS
ncbi:MAG: PKD domain-containing protein, partial [Paludibacteraceae bacterium]|nr:PKD domain-containing protein [Paludibacteraceae bacterium]